MNRLLLLSAFLLIYSCQSEERQLQSYEISFKVEKHDLLIPEIIKDHKNKNNYDLPAFKSLDQRNVLLVDSLNHFRFELGDVKRNEYQLIPDKGTLYATEKEHEFIYEAPKDARKVSFLLNIKLNNNLKYHLNSYTIILE